MPARTSRSTPTPPTDVRVAFSRNPQQNLIRNRQPLRRLSRLNHLVEVVRRMVVAADGSSAPLRHPRHPQSQPHSLEYPGESGSSRHRDILSGIAATNLPAPATSPSSAAPTVTPTPKTRLAIRIRATALPFRQDVLPQNFPAHRSFIRRKGAEPQFRACNVRFGGRQRESLKQMGCSPSDAQSFGLSCIGAAPSLRSRAALPTQHRSADFARLPTIETPHTYASVRVNRGRSERPIRAPAVTPRKRGHRR